MTINKKGYVSRNAKSNELPIYKMQLKQKLR